MVSTSRGPSCRGCRRVLEEHQWWLVFVGGAEASVGIDDVVGGFDGQDRGGELRGLFHRAAGRGRCACGGGGGGTGGGHGLCWGGTGAAALGRRPVPGV